MDKRTGTGSALCDCVTFKLAILIGLLDFAVLTHDVANHRLRAGDVGAVVYVYEEQMAYEVEFVTGRGDTVDVLTLTENDIRAVAHSEILHVRDTESIAGALPSPGRGPG